MRAKTISFDLAARVDEGKGAQHGTRKGLRYVVLGFPWLQHSSVWLSPGEVKKLHRYLEDFMDCEGVDHG